MNLLTTILIFSLISLGSVHIILDNQILANECIEYDETTKTINIECGSFSIGQLEQELNSDILSSDGKVFLLTANLHIGNFSKIFINSTETDWLNIHGASNDKN